MSSENTEMNSNPIKEENKPDKRETKPKKELTPQEIQNRKKMLVYPLFVLVFVGAVWLIFAPSEDKKQQDLSGFNLELPIPKEEGIVGDKRYAYEQENLKNKQNEKMRNLQDFAFSLDQGKESTVDIGKGTDPLLEDHSMDRKKDVPSISSSTESLKDINRQLGSFYDEPSTEAEKQEQQAMEERLKTLEKQLADKTEADQQLEMIEKSYAIASKYMPNNNQEQIKQVEVSLSTEKTIPKAISQVQNSVVSLLTAPMSQEEFMAQYSQDRNMGFVTAVGQEVKIQKNTIRASIYQTVTISNGNELQIRLLESIAVENTIIPANTILRGTAKLGGERLNITINSIQYANNIMPVEMEVYDLDGMQGISVPNTDEVTAMKEIAANMGTSMGSSITITDDAGSQLAADLSRSAIQGVSQFFSKKMREIKITLKAGYKILLVPKA